MDSNCPGLVLRVTEGGVRTFGVLYRVAGKGGVGGRGKPLMGPQQRFTLGKYPRIGLKQARERARAIIDEASEGVDPREAEAKARAIRNSTKIEDIVSQFVDRHCKPNIKAWQNVARALQLHVVPRLQGLSITEITRTDIHGLLDDLVDQGKKGTAREVRKHLSKLYNWAMDRQIVAASPVQGLMRGELAPAEDVGRALSDDELRAVWQAAGEIGYPFGPYYRLLILTGQRRNEWAEARVSEIDRGNRWLEVPRARYKGRRDHIVPLSPEALAIVDSLPAWAATTTTCSARTAAGCRSRASPRARTGSTSTPGRRCARSGETPGCTFPATASTTSASPARPASRTWASTRRSATPSSAMPSPACSAHTTSTITSPRSAGRSRPTPTHILGVVA